MAWKESTFREVIDHARQRFGCFTSDYDNRYSVPMECNGGYFDNYPEPTVAGVLFSDGSAVLADSQSENYGCASDPQADTLLPPKFWIWIT